MSDYQKELVATIHKFCQTQVEPFMEQDDHNSKFRMEIFRGFGQLGLAGLTLPETYGGAELPYSDFVTVLRTIAMYSVPYAVTISVSAMVQTMINEYGTEEQKQAYLPALTSGHEIGAFALSESGAGSDAASLKTTAKKVDGGWILNGSKLWITSGGVAQTYTVMARSGGDGASGISCFIVEKDTAGFSFGKAEKKMGWKTSPTRELIFNNCFIPDKNLLGAEGKGFKLAAGALDRGRFTIGAIAVGLSERALKEATKYALEREQFNQAIFEFQGLQFMLADMATEIEASKLMVEKAAQNFDEKTPDQKLASMAKMKASDTAMYVTTEAVQILGGVGYTSEYPLERYMRDAKVLQIVEGTNQIQKVVIARNLKKEMQS
ncbi:MAG: acyl-CoA dehydrogenase family protein [Bacteriovoracaceae bacterium]